MRQQALSGPLGLYIGSDQNIWAVNPADGRGYGLAQALENTIPAGSGGGASTGPLPSNVIYDADDFLFQRFATSGGAGIVWQQNTGTGFNWAPNEPDHLGGLIFNSQTSGGQAGKQGLWYLPTGTQQVAFSNVSKAVCRFVLKSSGSFAGASEWFCGFLDSLANQQNGALFSWAPGYTSLPAANGGGPTVNGAGGFLAGTYNNAAAGHYGYIQTNKPLVTSTWYDLVVVWTPTACRFYYAQFGQPLALVATITDNISTAIQYIMFGTNNNADPVGMITTLDKVELLFVLNNPIYMGQNLANL